MYTDGLWTGFWSYGEHHADFLATRHELRLAFDFEKITGTGIDGVGPFQMVGRIRSDKLHMTKQYLELHRLEYSGRLGFRGCLVGWWRLSGHLGGRFLWAPPGADADQLIAAYVQMLA